MTRKISAAILCLLPFLGSVTAWKSQGHLLVSRIAYDILESEDPTALKKANTVLKAYSDPKMTEPNEKDYPFVEGAVWADYIKYRGGSWQSGWHFVDIPFLDEGGSVNDYPKFKMDDKNISTAIPGIVSWFNQDSGYKEHYTYTTIMDKCDNDESKAQSQALRLLIHYFGDIHQPLHCLSRIDSKYPSGDAGGNAFAIPNHYDADNLHSVWDSVIYEFHKNDALPYTAETWATLGDSVTKLKSRFTISKSEYSNTDYDAWAQESYELGATYAYANIKEGEKLAQDYIDANNERAAKQIVLGGMRLAYVIKTMFGSSKAVSQEVAFLQ